MFQNILQKVLENNFGRFLNGLDKNNVKLGIWSGKILIENVTLKSEVIEMLELPIKLINSQIGKMELKIPWNKLSSSPIEVKIEDIYITIAPLLQKDWNFTINTEQKIQLLVNSCKDFIQATYNETKKQAQSEDKSFFDKLMIKIMDNMQIKVSNIHIRWEQINRQDTIQTQSFQQFNQVRQNFSWGITLQSLEVCTTDELWKKQFVDRTDNSISSQAMNRLFNLHNLALYWNDEEIDHQNQKESYYDYMSQRIYEGDSGIRAKAKSDFIVVISSEVKFIQNSTKQHLLPIYQAEIQLNWLNLALKRSQLKQLIQMLENFTTYDNHLWNSKQRAKQVTPIVLQQYHDSFLDLFQKIYMSETKQLDVLNDDEIFMIQQIVNSVSYNDLVQQTRQLSKKLVKDNKLSELNIKKQTKASGWSKFWNPSQQKEESNNITTEDVNQIEKEIENMFTDQKQEIINDPRPSDSIDVRFEILLKGGTFQVRSDLDNETDKTIEAESLEMIYENIFCKIEQLHDGTLEVGFHITSFQVRLSTSYYGKNVAHSPFIEQCQTQQSQEKQCFRMLLKKSFLPVQNNTQKRRLYISLVLLVQPFVCIYNLVVVKRLSDFFQSQDLDQSFKNKTWDKIEAFQDQTQIEVESLMDSEMKINLNIEIGCPILILPFNSKDDSECWVIKLGNLRMITEGDETNSDCYHLDLSSMNFQYLPSRQLYYLPDASNRIHQIMQSQKIKFQIRRVLDYTEDLSYFTVDGLIPPIVVNLTTYLFFKLQEISTLMVLPQSDIEQIETLQKEKSAILINQRMAGHIKLKDKSSNLWNHYYGVCSGAYLYLFKDIQDIHPEKSVYIKKAQIICEANQTPECENIFQVVTRYTKLDLLCPNQQELESWIFCLQQQSESTFQPQQIIKEDQVSSQSIQQNKIYLKISIIVQNLELILLKNDSYQSMQQLSQYQISIDNLRFSQITSTSQIIKQFSIDSICMLDYIHKYRNSEYQPFFKSYSENQQDPKNFLKIDMVQNKLDPQKDEWLTENTYQIDQLYLNWKPDVFLQLINLFQENERTEIITLQDEEASLKLKGHNDDQIRQIKINKLILVQDAKQQNQQKKTYADQSVNHYLLDQDSVLDNVQKLLNLFIMDDRSMNQNQIRQSVRTLSKNIIIINQAKINLIHQQSHICLGFLTLESLWMTSVKSQIASFNFGTLGNATLNDISNYPNSVDSEEEIIKTQYKIFQKQPHQVEPLLVFSDAVYEKENIRQSMSHFLKIELSPVKFNYMHQPVMRFIDYFMIQMITLIQSPEHLTMNKRFTENQSQLSKSSTIYHRKFVAGTVEQIFEEIFNPQFMSIEVTLNNSSIYLGKSYEDPNNVEVMVQKVSITNQHTQQPSRLIKEQHNIKIPIWCDNYLIDLEKISLRIYSNQEQQQISNFANYQLEFQKLLQWNELSELFPTLILDTHYNIKSSITPLKLDVIHLQYEYLCSVLMHNFSFDDQHDPLYIYDFEINQSIAPKEIKFNILLPKLSLLMRVDDIILSNVELNESYVNVLLKKNMDKIIKFQSNGLELSQFQNKHGGLEQIILVGRLGHKQQYQNTEEIRRTFIEREQIDQKLRQSYIGQQQCSADIILQNNPRIIELNVCLSDVGMSAESGIALQLAEWFLIAEESYPKKNDNTQTGYYVKINLQNVFLCFPVKEMTKILTARGNINYTFIRDAPKSTNNINNVNTSHKLTSSNLELFTSSNQAILESNDLFKRQLILPIVLYLEILDDLDDVFLVRKVDCYFEKTCIQVSHEDLTTINAAIEYQKDQIIDKQVVFQETDSLVLQQKPSPLDIQDSLETFLSFSCVFNAIQVVWFNASNMAQPLFDLYFNECQVLFTQKVDQIILRIQSQVQTSHYNNTIQVWEPFIELFLLDIEHQFNEHCSPKFNTVIVFNPEQYHHVSLNINLTSVIIKKLGHILQDLNDFTERSLKQPTKKKWGISYNQDEPQCFEVLKPNSNQSLVIRNLLPVCLSFVVIDGDEYYCLGFQEIYLPNRQLNQDLKVQVKLPGFQISQVITLINKTPLSKQFSVKDYLGIELKLNYVFIGQSLGYHTFLLQSDIIIQQTLGRPLYFYGRQLTQREKEGKPQQPIRDSTLHPLMEYIAGQTIPGITEEEDLVMRNGGSVFVANQFDLMQLSFQQGGQTKELNQQQQFSMQFPVKNGIGRYLIRIPLLQGYQDVIGQTTNNIIDKSKFITLTINPQCVIINEFDRDITISQDGVQDQQIQLKKGQRVPLFWFSNSSKYLQFYYQTEKGLCRTGLIGLDIAGTLTCPTRLFSNSEVDPQIYDYISLSSLEDSKTQYIKLEALTKNLKPLFLIQNRLPGVQLKFGQLFQQQPIIPKSIINVNQESAYAFDHPTHPSIIEVEMIRNNQIFGKIQIDLNKADWTQKYVMKQSQNTNFQFYIRSKFSIEHKQIVIRFQEQRVVQELVQIPQLIESQFQIDFSSITISIISTPDSQNKRRKEIMLLLVEGVKLVQVSDAHVETLQMNILNLQIDSNRQTQCKFPVALTAQNKQQLKKQKRPLITCLVQRAHNIQFVNYFKSIEIAIQPLIIKLTEGTLEDLYYMYVQINEASQAPANQQIKIKLTPEQNQLISPFYQWQTVEIYSYQVCFLERVEIYPLTLDLSFLMQEATGDEFHKLLKLPSTFLNIDQAQIKLRGYRSQNLQQTLTQFFTKLGRNYQDDFISNILKLVGSMEILGNPIGFIRNVSNGFQDLWEMPKEGFVQGPIEGGVGIAKGVGALTKGVVSGTFNSVQKITGGLAKGISVMSMVQLSTLKQQDKQYQKERVQKRQNEPQDLVSGVGQGMVSLFSGIEKGITGLIIEPIKGADQGGVEGFFKGTLKGLAGLIVKPVVGVMDMTSKTAEGIKNSANFFDEKPSLSRYRPPRVFYSIQQFYKNYKIQDSEISELLQDINKQYANLDLIDIVTQRNQNQLFVYLITIQYFLLVDVRKRNIKFQVPSKQISGIIVVSEKEIHIHLQMPLKNVEDCRAAGVTFDQQKIKILCDDVKTLNDQLNHLVQIIHQK